jgi:hypothetical protein
MQAEARDFYLAATRFPILGVVGLVLTTIAAILAYVQIRKFKRGVRVILYYFN